MSARSRRLAASWVLAVAGALACAPSSQAKVDADYLSQALWIEMGEHFVPTGQPTDNSNNCFGNLRAVSGGAFWDGPAVTPGEADGFWTSSLAPLNERRWYAAGGNVSGGNAGHARYVQCLPKDKLRGTAVKVRDFEIGNLGHGGGRVSCPGEKRIFGGGAFWHEGDGTTHQTDANDAWLSSSYPTAGRRAWYADGENRTGDDYVLRVVASCIPPERFSKIKVRKAHHEIEDGETGGGTRACKGDEVALTGGAYRRRGGEGPSPTDGDDFRLSSMYHGDPGGWVSGGFYADAYNFSGDAEPWTLTVVAYCLT